MTHNDDRDYIINSASLSSQVAHWKASELSFSTVQPLDWINALHDGMKNWGSAAENKEKRQRKRKRNVPSPSAVQIDPNLE